MNEQIKRQYEGVYGPFANGDYAIGDQLGDGIDHGEIIWSYLASGRMTYVIVSAGFPVEIPASDVKVESEA